MQAKISKLLTFFVVALVSFAFSYNYWIDTKQNSEYLSLSLYKPFVFRQLLPMLARVLTWFGVPANWSIVLVMTAAGICFYYALRALILHYYQIDDLYILLAWLAGLLLFSFERLPSDWMTACLFSLALLFLAQDKILAYALLFPIICLNRETAFLLTIFYLFYDHDIHMGQDIAMMLYQVFAWIAIRLSLMYIFRNNGGTDAWVMPVHNFQVFIAHPWHSLLHIAITGAILFWVFKNWYSKPYNLRLAFSIFAPILLVAYWVLGQSWEVRVMWEVYPVTAILAYKSMQDNFISSNYSWMRKTEKVVLCDGGIPDLEKL